MLSGEVPFRAPDSLAVAIQHLQDEPAPLTECDPNLPVELCRIVHRLLAKAPEQRFASADELRAALSTLDLSRHDRVTPQPASAIASGDAGLTHCPECRASIEPGFLTCPKCGLWIRQRCGACERLFDPLLQACPFGRTPNTPTPAPAPAAPPNLGGQTEVVTATPAPTLAGPASSPPAADAVGADRSDGAAPVPGKLSLPWMEMQTGKDVAILKIEGRDLPTVRVGDSERVQIGDNVHMAGYPGVVMSHPYLNPQSVLEASFTRGQVSALRLDIKGSNVLQMDAAMIWGNSGGPIFSDGGEVVGMATFGSIAEGSGSSQAIQGFNFAVPASVVREFMRSTGVVTEPSVFDRTWDRALSLYYAGNHRAAIGAFDEVLRLMPDLPDAIKLRRESILLVDQGVGGGRLSWLVLGVTGGGVLLLAVGLVMRRGRSAPRKPGLVRAAPRPLGRLVVRSGPQQGNPFPVPRDGIKIGRDPDSCQVVLSEATVSREHAVLLLAGANGDVMIRTLSGTNPTFVNDRPIQEATLKSGDQIKIGNSILSYENW